MNRFLPLLFFLSIFLLFLSWIIIGGTKENPNPLTHPGVTWDKKGRKDSHRIDYIFYKGKSIKSTKSNSYNAFFNEPIIINGKKIPYPSDHGIVVTSFKLK